MNVQSRVASTRLMRNSAYLLASTVISAGLGFIFWLIAARYVSVDAVGQATTLVAATIVISYLSLLGLNSTLIRFLPVAGDGKNALATSVLATVAVMSGLLSFGYAELVPRLVGKLSVLQGQRAVAVFVAVTVASAVNLATDSVFIAERRAFVNMVVDGFVCGLAKLAALVVIVTMTNPSPLTLFAAYGLAALLGAVVSLVWMRVYGYRFRGVRRGGLQGLFGFSISSYAGSIFNLAPTLLLPIIVLQTRGAAQESYFYMALQLANLLYAVAFAVGENILSEGAHGEEPLPQLLRRAGRLTVASLAPATVALVLLAHPLLSLLGAKYAAHGTRILIVFALAALPVGLNNWSGMLLKLRNRLVGFVVTNVAYCAVILGVAVWLSRYGLAYVAIGWLLGNLVSGLSGAIWGIVGRDAAVLEQPSFAADIDLVAANEPVTL